MTEKDYLRTKYFNVNTFHCITVLLEIITKKIL